MRERSASFKSRATAQRIAGQTASVAAGVIVAAAVVIARGVIAERDRAHARRRKPERRVRRGDQDAAARQMAREDPREELGAGRVERGRRLVEDPQRPRQHREPREPDSPALSLRQHARRQRALARERHVVERGAQRLAGHRFAVEREQRCEVFLGGELVLERGKVSRVGEHAAKFGIRGRHDFAVPRKRP